MEAYKRRCKRFARKKAMKRALFGAILLLALLS